MHFEQAVKVSHIISKIAINAQSKINWLEFDRIQAQELLVESRQSNGRHETKRTKRKRKANRRKEVVDRKHD